MAKRKTSTGKIRRPTGNELRIAANRCRQRARNPEDHTGDDLTWMELGTLLDTTDGHNAIDVIWQAFTVGYPTGATSGNNTEPSSSTERAALNQIDRRNLTGRSDPAAITLRILIPLVENRPVDTNQARTLVAGIRSAMNHPSRTGVACTDCGHIIDAKRRKCWRKDCPSNAPDRTCARCGQAIPDDERIVAGMHRSCYNAKHYADNKPTVKDERGTDTINIHDTEGIVSTEDAA